MSNLSNTIANGFITTFREYTQEVRSLADELTEEQFWVKPYPYGNSFGHLILHITGNLNYYIGAQIANTGYVRNRDLEFTDDNPPLKEVALQRMNDAIELVIKTLESQTADSWMQDYSADRLEWVKDRYTIFLICSTHFYNHIGQMIYLKYQHTNAQSNMQ